MNEAEVNEFRKILEARLKELHHTTRRREMIAVEGTADALDGRLRATEREFATRNLEAGMAKLRETRDALDRIGDGTYGSCSDCGVAISPGRLAAVPWAALCIRCQEAADCRVGTPSHPRGFAMAA